MFTVTNRAVPASLRAMLGRSAAVAVVLLTGCVSQLSPSTFDVAASNDAIGDIQRALAQQSVTADRIDERAGIIETPWENTGTNSDGTIWAIRYVITLAPGAGSDRVTVLLDLRTCEGGLGTTPHTGRLDASSCQRLPPGMTPVMYQDQLDAFAERLRGALRGVSVVS